jgi:hypothetical protein
MLEIGSLIRKYTANKMKLEAAARLTRTIHFNPKPLLMGIPPPLNFFSDEPGK